MVVVLKAGATEEQIAAVVEIVEEAGGDTFVSRGKNRTIVGLLGDTERFMALPLATLPGVEEVVRIGKPYKLVAAESRPSASIVQVGNVPIGVRSDARHKETLFAPLLVTKMRTPSKATLSG